MRTFPLKLILSAPLALAAASVVVGCATGEVSSAPSRPAASARVEAIEYRGWDAYRLSNGTVEAIVVPSIGRIMHYGYAADGEAGNVLWTHPDLDGVEEQSTGDWQNFGGDKVWPWPQNESGGVAGWPAHVAENWPPPADFRGIPWDAAVEDGSLVMTLPDSDEFAVAVRRRITLAATGSELVVESTFLPTVADAPYPVGPWHITQIPQPTSTVVALGETTAPLAPTWLGDAEREGDVVQVVIPMSPRDGHAAIELLPMEGEQDAKVGLDVNILAAGMERAERSLVYVQNVVAAKGERYTTRAERAQVYLANPNSGGLVPWTELEFAGPVGGRAALAVRWQLVEVPSGTSDNPPMVARAAAEAVR